MNTRNTFHRLFSLTAICLAIGFGPIACDGDGLDGEARDADMDPVQMLLEVAGQDGGAATQLVAYADDCGDHDPGDTWAEDCNTCTCTAAGTTLCTQSGCDDSNEALATEPFDAVGDDAETPHEDRQAPSSIPADPVDEEGCGPHGVGDSWPVDCNMCFCQAPGVVECTIIDCSGGGEISWH